MALTQSDLDALDTAIAGAELEVEVDGRRVKYRSIDELQKARSHVASVLAGSSAAAAGPGGSGAFFRPRFTTSRGD
jgi:hypothetical protein